MSDISFAARLKPDQHLEIASTRSLRDTARDLRERVSQGSYDDEALKSFWSVVGHAGVTLRESNPQLAERAGLGSKFFSSVARDLRRPKLPNFLKALVAIEEVANERLADVDQVLRAPHVSAGGGTVDVLQRDAFELFMLARSLHQLAEQELERLKQERPNHTDGIARNQRQSEILTVLADGFARISQALGAMCRRPTERGALENARTVVQSVGDEVEKWWSKNGESVVDWGIRLPTITAGIAMLSWAGAEMTIATACVATIVGGEKVADVIKASNNRSE